MYQPYSVTESLAAIQVFLTVVAHWVFAEAEYSSVNDQVLHRGAVPGELALDCRPLP